MGRYKYYKRCSAFAVGEVANNASRTRSAWEDLQREEKLSINRILAILLTAGYQQFKLWDI